LDVRRGRKTECHDRRAFGASARSCTPRRGIVALGVHCQAILTRGGMGGPKAFSSNTHTYLDHRGQRRAPGYHAFPLVGKGVYFGVLAKYVERLLQAGSTPTSA
jgi:hypothetical protein